MNPEIEELIQHPEVKIERNLLIDIYKHRCVRCGRGANLQIHEIVYKSRRPKTWMMWENQVVLCYDCHTFMHRIGKRSVPLLHDLQNRRLIEYYGTRLKRDEDNVTSEQSLFLEK